MGGSKTPRAAGVSRALVAKLANKSRFMRSSEFPSSCFPRDCNGMEIKQWLMALWLQKNLLFCLRGFGQRRTNEHLMTNDRFYFLQTACLSTGWTWFFLSLRIHFFTGFSSRRNTPSWTGSKLLQFPPPFTFQSVLLQPLGTRRND